MTAWKNWDTQLLTYQGDPLTRENIAVVDAFQHVEGHGGDFNPFNVGPGPFHGVNLSNPPYSGQPSPYPPTLDFPSGGVGVAASEVVGESNWSSLLSALKTGHPLSYSWLISQGAATPADQYTQEVRSLAQAYLSGSSTYDLGDTSLNRSEPGGSGQIPPGGGSPPPSNCTNDNFSMGSCNSAGVGNIPKDATGYPCCADTLGSSSAPVTGACADPNCTQCCGAGIANTGAGSGGGSSGGSCQCAHVHIPILGGFNLLPCFICDFFDAITSEAFWVRAGEVILGLILLAIGLRMFISSRMPSLSKTATDAAAVAVVA